MTQAKAASPYEDTRAGLLFAVGAYFIWGLLPLYLQFATHIPVLEFLAHRILWSVPLAAIVIVATRRYDALIDALTHPKTLALAALTSTLLMVNWGTYVFAVVTDRALDAALGYYINPLFSMFLAATLLGDRLNRLQLIAVLIAAIAVIVLVAAADRPPWIPLALTVSWGFYALCKRWLDIGPNQGFMLEVLILSVPALIYLLFFNPQSSFMPLTTDSLLLMGAGLVTTVPLLLYVNGAKRLRLSTIAILQYIAPTLVFLIAVIWFGETMDLARKIAFPMIWTALIIYTAATLIQTRKAQG